VLANLPAAALLEMRFPRIDPVALDVPGPIDIRWYGMMYLVGFAIAYLILRKISREGFLKMDPEAVGDLIVALVLGVILGARIGYILFYDFQGFAENPARILRLWEGGLSFHGGFLGVLIASTWFARSRGIPYVNLIDSLALAIPPGIFLVRGANFVNGELYGRITSDQVPWAVRFPTDPVALRLLGAERLPLRERERAILDAYDSSLWATVREQVPLRHPSQLYEGILEGVVLGIILWLVYLLWARKPGSRLSRGALSGIFIFGYGVFRSFVELFRQPDVQFTSPDDPLGTVLGPLTMGQTLSLVMILGGAALLAWSVLRKPPRPTG
jgi:phosphatidylglycerol---prolipoprotein diacylglyceryl transferase